MVKQIKHYFKTNANLTSIIIFKTNCLFLSFAVLFKIYSSKFDLYDELKLFVINHFPMFTVYVMLCLWHVNKTCTYNTKRTIYNIDEVQREIIQWINIIHLREIKNELICFQNISDSSCQTIFNVCKSLTIVVNSIYIYIYS